MSVHVVCFYFLSQNPQFYNASTYVVFAQLLKQLAKLPAQSHLSLTRWLQEYKPDHFREIIAKVQQFISVRLFPPDPSELPSSSKSTWWLSSAAKVLALLSGWCIISYVASWRPCLRFFPLCRRSEFAVLPSSCLSLGVLQQHAGPH